MSDSTNKGGKSGKRQHQQVPAPPAPQSASPPSLGSSVQTTSSLGSGSGEVEGGLASRPSPRPSPTPPAMEEFAKSEQEASGRSNGMTVAKEAESDFASEVAMATVNSVLPCDDDFDEDDLGFDPFQETQKGFADLLESETRQQQQQQQQQQRRVLQQQPDPLPLHHSFQAPGQVLLQPQAHQSNGRHSFMQATPSSSSQQALSRPKAPPPGFGGAGAGAGAATGAGGLPGLARFQSNGGIGLGGLDGLANHLSPTSPYSSSQDLLSRLGRGVSPPPGVQPPQHSRQQQLFAQQQQSNSLMPHQQDGKDWQDGLRALLPPNVNLSFSNGGGNGFQQRDAAGVGANRTANQLRFHREEQQDRRKWFFKIPFK